MKDLSFYSEITKGQLLSNENMRGPEQFVTKYINAWARDKISRDVYQAHQELWDHYGEILGHQLVLKNDLFPVTIPIGYVIESFFESVELETPERKHVIKSFNTWIQADNGKVRQELFEYYGNAPYRYPMSFNQDSDENPEDADSDTGTENTIMQQADLLYGPPQDTEKDTEL